ncbi:hypothetical protein [Blastococcus sp. PRF04-17]|uniref:hypothetical protein n=1 Tax=Blastococcus sp. PRF04-17 TaxID=2933797 RepID=UPI001FF37F41|nr:hypothetical protein [Blastococcus sp. PRF04-17]UOY03703.1 hypothetical protein MVA48_10390 [Blastococcus sp. PRF04-17]
MAPNTPPGRSAAAARRRLRELQTTVLRPDALVPPQLNHLLEGFRPQGAIKHRWAALQPAVAQVLSRSAISGADSLRKHVTHVAYFLAWADDHDLPLTPKTVQRRYVDEYTRTGMPDSSAKSRADRRARLRRLADQINPDQAPDRGVTVERPSVKPPYTEREMAQIRRVALTQPTAARRRQLCLCVGLGAGAGLDSQDLRHLTRAHVRDTGDGGITVEVPEPSPRAVVVLRDYEGLVRIGLGDLKPHALLLGRKEDRRNLAARAIGHAVVLGDVPHIEQSRLRATWLARLMTAAVPLQVVLTAAGLRSARTLVDLLPHLPTGPDTHTVLRDAGGAR